MVGNDVTVTVLSVRRQQVRLGVTAPKSVGVHREEVFERIQAAKSQECTGVLQAVEALD